MITRHHKKKGGLLLGGVLRQEYLPFELFLPNGTGNSFFNAPRAN